MASLDIISNGFTCIMNAQKSKKNKVEFSTNSILTGVVEVLLKKNYIMSYEKINKNKKNLISVNLKYNGNGDGVIYEFKRHSKRSRRFYSSFNNIPRVNNGFATIIVSTSRGIMTGKEARENKVGGEVICHIF